MKRIALVFLAAFLLVIAVGFAFYAQVGSHRALSSHGEDWAQFGNYFGGVAGTLLSFISILLLVYTVHYQLEQLSDAKHETLKRDLLAHVTKADDEIQSWLQRKLATDTMSEQTVEFGDVVWGILDTKLVSQREFKPAVVRLHVLTCLYCEALALYRDNIDPFFIFKYHQQKAESLLQFLGKHQSLLEQMAGPSLMICRGLLSGERTG